MIKNARPLKHTMLFLFLVVLTGHSCSKDSTLLPDPATEEMQEQTQDIDPETSTEETTPEEIPTTEDEEGTTEETDSKETSCTDPAGFIFNEKDGLVQVEFENTDFSGNWKLRSNGNSHSGDGYLVWEGSQFFNDPGNGLLTYKIKIENPGTYKFLWNSSIKTGDNGTEHNDTWLRFNDADDFFGLKNGSSTKIYPVGTGKSPNPKGASKNGWFKIFRSGNDLDFKWQSRTSDNDAHEVFVKFNSPGTYLMEVSARSSGHAIDKFLLFNDSMSEADAISGPDSITTCN